MGIDKLFFVEMIIFFLIFIISSSACQGAAFYKCGVLKTSLIFFVSLQNSSTEIFLTTELAMQVLN